MRSLYTFDNVPLVTWMLVPTLTTPGDVPPPPGSKPPIAVSELLVYAVQHAELLDVVAGGQAVASAVQLAVLKHSESKVTGSVGIALESVATVAIAVFVTVPCG